MFVKNGSIGKERSEVIPYGVSVFENTRYLYSSMLKLSLSELIIEDVDLVAPSPRSDRISLRLAWRWLNVAPWVSPETIFSSVLVHPQHNEWMDSTHLVKTCDSQHTQESFFTLQVVVVEAPNFDSQASDEVCIM